METPARFTFSPDGNTKVFPIPVTMKGDNYVRIDIDGVILNDRTKFDLVNNAVVFVNISDVPSGSQLDVLVVQTDEGISNLGSTTAIDIVSQNITDVNAVADSISAVDTTAANIASVNNVSTNMATVVDAVNQANAAATSAAAALVSENAAEASETAAGASATSAATSAANSATSASNSASSASAAATSATAASGSASAAATSATNAATSATSSANSASAAATSATAAANSATNAANSATNSANSASSAAGSATNAASSASSALTSKNAAATSATNASNSATSASNSATAAAASQSSASASASAALVSETNAAASEAAAETAETNTLAIYGSTQAVQDAVTNSAASATAAATSETNAAASALAAETSEVNAADSASTSTIQAGLAAGSASASATSATDSAAARDASQGYRDTANLHKLAAEAAATSATNTAAALTGFDLEAIAASKAVTAVDVFVYDTSKDSDGGAWRKRTQHTSWYNETLNTATRGSRREFPAVAVIVAEATKVTIYDGDDPALPMWMVFNGGSGGFLYTGAKAVTMLNGLLVSGNNLSLAQADLVKDEYFFRNSNGTKWNTENILNRNKTGGPYNTGLISAIVNSTVNDVAMTVLPDAPIDPATGLPVPTIAVATAGGVSVITDSGAVYDTTVGFTPVGAVSFDADGNLFNRRNTGNDWCAFSTIADYTSGDGFGDLFAAMTIGNQAVDMLGGPSNNAGDFGGTFVEAGSLGLGLHKLNTTAFSQSLSAKVTSTYNTGWMNGDIKGAFLSSTDTASLVGSGELVTNGTFDTDTSGWTAIGDETISSVSGRLRVTYGADGFGGGSSGTYQTISGLTIGQTYSLVCGNRYVGTNGAVGVRVTTAAGGGTILASFYGFANASSEMASFVATSTTLYVQVYGGYGTAGTYVEADNVSVKLADADRSVNNNGLIVNGTVTRSEVSSGAELVAYSGFSASNYLEQPYNSALDFGTGDFCVMGWVYSTATTTQAFLDRIDTGSSGPQLRIILAAGTGIRVTAGAVDFTPSSSNIPLNTWTHIAVTRRSGVIYVYADGVLSGSVASTGDLTNTSAILRVGLSVVNTIPSSAKKSLIRISATAPTAEQIKKIYDDEKALFQENAAATLYGTSDAVTALAHDEDTGLLHVGTSAGRSVFQGLRRVSNTTTAVGTAISASGGMVVEE